MKPLTTCPACNYTRQPSDIAQDWVCPKCQKAYNKTSQSSDNPKKRNLLDTSTQSSQDLITAKATEDYLRKRVPFIDQWYNQFDSHFDASLFRDSVASQTKWTTAAVNVTVERQNRKLKEIGTGRLEYGASFGMKAFGYFFILCGIVSAVANSFNHLSAGRMVLLLLVSSLFIILGAVVLFKSAVPLVFDKQRGLFWIGKMTPASAHSTEPHPVIKLQDIYAIQLIYWNGDSIYAGITKTPTRQHARYELNLILTGGKREFIVNATQYYKTRLQADASSLAKFLGVPLWDAIDETRGVFDKNLTQADYDRYFEQES